MNATFHQGAQGYVYGSMSVSQGFPSELGADNQEAKIAFLIEVGNVTKRGGWVVGNEFQTLGHKGGVQAGFDQVFKFSHLKARPLG